MTIIPPEQKDPQTGRFSSEIPSAFESLDVVSHDLSKRIDADVETFVSDTTVRLGGLSRAESGLPPSDVAAVRKQSGLFELPRLLDDARMLGAQTSESIRQSSRSPVMSQRALKALGRDIAASGEPIVPIPSAPPVPREIASSSFDPEQESVERQEVASRLPTEVLRLQRDLDLANAMDRLEVGDSLRPRETEMLAGALEGRGWQRLCSEIHPGDGLAAFLVPSEKRFSIKHFNDVLFGMQRTDDVIKYRRDLLMREIATFGVERMATSYKDEQYRIPKERLESEGEERIFQDLTEATERIRLSMSAKLAEMAALEWAVADDARRAALDGFAESLVGTSSMEAYVRCRSELIGARQAWEETVRREAEALQQWHAIGVDRPDERRRAEVQYEHAKQLSIASQEVLLRKEAEMKQDVVTPALKANPTLGYRMTFGIEEVGEAESESSMVHIERAVSQSTKAAMMARQNAEGGLHFSKEAMDGEIARALALRDRIGIQEISDAGGRVYPIFEIRPDGKGAMIHVMNLDLIREIRKGSFRVADDARQRELYGLVSEYIGAINVLDVTKPYLHEELEGGVLYGTDQTVQGTIEKTGGLTRRLREGGLSESERAEIVAILRSDAKDRACTSVAEFHQKALEFSNCSYLSLDVLDVGPELLQEYELLIQRVANGRMTFDEAQLIAGDATTRRMRDFRARVSEAYRELCHGEEPLMSVGGDEIVLAMDTARVTDEFMLKLRDIKLNEREGASVRVVRTVVGSGERRSGADGEARKKDHLEAIKRAEAGTAAAKRIETIVRSIRSGVYDLPRAERSAEFEALTRLNVASFAVHQREGSEGFELILKDPASDGSIHANLEEKVRELEELAGQLAQRVETRRRQFYDEYSATHPKLTRELVPIALRRKDQNMEGFEHFMNALV